MQSPADYCREDWHCLICGAPKEKLYRPYRYNPEAVRCRGCYFSYKLQIPTHGSGKRYVPKPKYNKRMRDVWYRAHLHFKDPRDVFQFMSGFSTTAQMNNAMNRLDGGGMIARERASREAKEKDRDNLGPRRR